MKVLVVAAHADDEVLGCGGTIARHVREGDDVLVLILAGLRDNEKMRTGTQVKALRDAAKALDFSYNVLGFIDQKFDTHPFLDIVQRLELEAREYAPEIIYTHHGGDLNMDHRITYQAVLTAFRPLPGSTVKAIYGFEVRSSTEWGLQPFVPTHYVTLDVSDQLAKWNAVLIYKNEMREVPHTRSEVAIGNQVEQRGYEVGHRWAEAFTTIRTIT